MSVSSLALTATWRDYYGMWSSLVEPNLAPLEFSKCHAPRFVLLPDVSHQVFPASGKILYNFHLVPGSLIWGLWAGPYGSFSQIPAIQLTDITMGHQFFQDPADETIMFTPMGDVGDTTGVFLFPCPHPVIGDGLFKFEAWGPPGQTFLMLLGVAEITDCPVR